MIGFISIDLITHLNLITAALIYYQRFWIEVVYFENLSNVNLLPFTIVK